MDFEMGIKLNMGFGITHLLRELSSFSFWAPSLLAWQQEFKK
jgi:hypothetical protein